MAMGDVIARLAVALNLETAAFDKGAREASTTVGRMQATMSKAASAIGAAFLSIGIGELVTQFRDMTKAALDSAGGLGEAASQIGVTTKALQEYRFAATQVGLSQQEMDLGLAQLTRRLGDAAQGVKEPAAALERLGITLDSIKGKDTGDVIPLIAEGLSKIPDPGQRAAIAVDLFGKSGQKLLPLLEGGAKGVEQFRVEAERLGLVLSEGEIAKADETADKLAALNYQIEAQQNKKLLENADAIVAYEEAVGNFKLALITAVGDLEEYNQRYNAWAIKFHDNLAKGFVGPEEIREFVATLRQGANQAIAEVSRLVTGVQTWMVNKLNAIWASVKAKIDAVKGYFYGLYDAVVGHSYVPDMVDGIAAQMQRLDAVMVAPAKAATGKVSQAMRQLADDTRAILDRLFPEVRQLLDYRKDLATIEGSDLPGSTKDEARRRLGLEAAGYAANDNIPLSEGVTEQGSLITGTVDKVLEKFDQFGKKSGAVTVQVAKSFKDMADATVQSLQNLAGAIKGGGFLDILSAVVGLGLQLGSIGAFGKKIQTNINSSKIPGYAGGTSFHPGGLAIVGERGPELVSMPRGSRVYPNGTGPAQNVHVTVGVDPRNGNVTAYVDGRIAASAPALIEGGGRAGAAKVAYQQRRRVG